MAWGRGRGDVEVAVGIAVGGSHVIVCGMSRDLATMPFADVYPHYVHKVERKGRTVAELHAVIAWLTGFSEKEIKAQIATRATLREFFKAATLNRNAKLITGSICGIKVQEIKDPLMRRIRYLDKVVDELAKGWPLEKIFRA
jgi:hypothetical protein